MGIDIIGISLEEDVKVIAVFVPPNYTGSKVVLFLIGGGIKLPFITHIGIFLRLLRYENYAMKLNKKIY